MKNKHNWSLSLRNGLPRAIMKQAASMHGRSFYPPHGMDRAEQCLFGAEYWNLYPADYTYDYNSWGYRAQDFEQYIGQEVNLCFGDSQTLNMSGPAEHSWPAQLSHYFDIPTLNFGIDGLSFFSYVTLWQKVQTVYRVRHVFALFNTLRTDGVKANRYLPALNSDHMTTDLKFFREWCLRPDWHFQFNPPWTFRDDERRCLLEYFPQAHDYLKPWRMDLSQVNLQLLLSIMDPRQRYQDIAGASWISYEKFCEIYLVGGDPISYVQADIDRRLLHEYITQTFVPVLNRMLMSNRDGWHMSRRVNGLLAQYFARQAGAITLDGHD